MGALRDLIVFAIVLLTLPSSFRRPFVGLLVFSWLAYMRPQDLCWGFARSMRMSFFVGLAILAGWWAFERGRRPFARWDLRSSLMLVLTLLVTISYSLAKFQDEYVTRYYFEFLKIIVVALFTSGQVDSKQRFRVLTWTIALCLAFYGIKGGLFGLVTGGATIMRGPGGMLEDNNDFALALVMNVPLLWYLGHNDRDLPFARIGTRIGIVLTIITILLTHSRGAFLSLCGATLWIAWRSKQLVRAGVSLVFLAIAFLALAPQSVLDRIATIGDTKESSASARLTAWKVAFRMIEDNPFFGVGLRNFQLRYLDYAEVSPEMRARATTYVAHNSYLQIWAESGSLAFGVYLLLLGSVFVVCRRVYRMGQLRRDLAWCLDYARMMEATTVGFMIGAVFLNRGHFDLLYHWLALVTSLSAVATAAWLRGPAQQAARGERSVSVRRRGVFAAAGTQADGRKIQPRWGRVT